MKMRVQLRTYQIQGQPRLLHVHQYSLCALIWMIHGKKKWRNVLNARLSSIWNEIYVIFHIWILYTHCMYSCAAVCYAVTSPSYPLLSSPDPIWNLECAASQIEHMSPSRRGVLDVFHVPRNLHINIYPEIRLRNLKGVYRWVCHREQETGTG